MRHAEEMTLPDSLVPILEDLPEAVREESAQALTRYLEIVIAIWDEAEAEDPNWLTDDDEPPTLSYSV